MLAAHHWWRQAENFPEPGGPLAVRPSPALSGGPTVARSRTLRLATYNIQLGNRLDRVADVVRREPALGAADILALQEADEAAVERLAGPELGYVYYASSRHPSSGRNFGPALLSRWPILDHQKLVLPGAERPGRLLRVAVRATLQVHGVPMRVYGLHLSTLWETTRRGQDDQARAVLEDAASSTDPVIIIGDLNRRGAARVFERAGYQWLTRRVGSTHYLWSFDHILARGVGMERVHTGLLASGLEASDHKAVFAEVALLP